tara:strand:+ start:3248 stop:4177 length:930 start_codon:yes stop_codon:yes gene_type:complete
MILICSEDREAYGYGHRSRMLALIDIFEALEIDFICAITNLQWEAALKIKKIKTIVLSQTSGDENEAKELINKAEEYLDDIQLFFCDGNRFENSYLSTINKFFKKNILIDDLGLPIRDQAEIVWNPNIYASSSLYNNWENIQLFAGEKYVLLRKEFERPIKPIKKKSIFVSLGTAASDNIISIIDHLAKEYEFSVILSGGFSVNEMIDAIDNSLFTICGASVTLHEVWRRNTIALPVYQVKDQFHFKQFLIENRIDFINILDKNKLQIKNNFNELFNKYFSQEPFTNNNSVKMGSIKNDSKLIINELHS